MRIFQYFCSIVLIALMVLCPSRTFADLVIEPGRQVTLHYVLSINSQAVESTQRKEPLRFVVGSKSIIPGLEKQLIGMSVGQEKKIIVDAVDAYGPVNAKAFKEVPRTMMPQGFEIKPGVVVEVDDPQGGSYPGVVWEVKQDSVVLNFNHPLAGQTLEFDVKILAIE